MGDAATQKLCREVLRWTMVAQPAKSPETQVAEFVWATMEALLASKYVPKDEQDFDECIHKAYADSTTPAMYSGYLRRWANNQASIIARRGNNDF